MSSGTGAPKSSDDEAACGGVASGAPSDVPGGVPSGASGGERSGVPKSLSGRSKGRPPSAGPLSDEKLSDRDRQRRNYARKKEKDEELARELELLTTELATVKKVILVILFVRGRT